MTLFMRLTFLLGIACHIHNSSCGALHLIPFNITYNAPDDGCLVAETCSAVYVINKVLLTDIFTQFGSIADGFQ
jgi:hypothetical protein